MSVAIEQSNVLLPYPLACFLQRGFFPVTPKEFLYLTEIIETNIQVVADRSLKNYALRFGYKFSPKFFDAWCCLSAFVFC